MSLMVVIPPKMQGSDDDNENPPIFREAYPSLWNCISRLPQKCILSQFKMDIVWKTQKLACCFMLYWLVLIKNIPQLLFSQFTWECYLLNTEDMKKYFQDCAAQLQGLCFNNIQHYKNVEQYIMYVIVRVLKGLLTDFLLKTVKVFKKTRHIWLRHFVHSILITKLQNFQRRNWNFILWNEQNALEQEHPKRSKLRILCL